ncbi:MAG: hypothetical protein HY403_09315 [Elusimicrobia bacterium]|nr:hypothetical protein [Elusimicrobiota bacterium]
MTVPAAPLPAIAGLIRALPAVKSSEGEPWLRGDRGRRAAFYGRGSAALAVAASVLRENAAGGWKLWVPEYFCGDALAPARRLGIPLSFYPVKEDLSPDFPEDLAGPGALLLVHYFGFPNAAAAAGAACRRAGLTLIEDAAHVLIPCDGIGSSDWAIYSPRKLLALPSGGLLILPEKAVSQLPAAEPPEAGESARWALRRLTQSALRVARIPWHGGRSVPAAADGSDPAVRACSVYALSLLKQAEIGFGEVARRRRENFYRVASWIGHVRDARPLHHDLPDAVCPYAYPLRVPDAERFVGALRASGVPAYRWPDLPPEAGGPVARRLAAEMVLLPVHQSLLPRELERMRVALLEAGRA